MGAMNSLNVMFDFVCVWVCECYSCIVMYKIAVSSFAEILENPTSNYVIITNISMEKCVQFFSYLFDDS